MSRKIRLLHSSAKTQLPMKTTIVPALALCCTCALAHSDDLYVAFEDTQVIVKFDVNGNGSMFASTGGWSSPNGVAFDSSGNLYVANFANDSIGRFDPNGQGSVSAST